MACGGWPVQDYALINLDRPATELVQVSPIFVQTPAADIRQDAAVTLVGYGSTHAGSSTTHCRPYSGRA
ncbi:MAG: hypothetical protein MI919_11970 [Holophagales bacterium]|nr:hypothetical protein [Holophagales bacterium]